MQQELESIFSADGALARAVPEFRPRTQQLAMAQAVAQAKTSVEVHVLQGERQMARDNRTLGRFHLVGLPPAPRGVPQIEVTFDIDANGIVNVSAKDLGTSQEQKITITSSSGLSKEEVARMMKEAEAHAEDDRKRREEVEARNRADQAVYAAEKLLRDSGDRLSAADKQPIESAVADLKKAIDKGDTGEMNQAMERLTQAQHRAAEVLYRQAQTTGAGAKGPAGTGEEPEPGRPPQGDVIDAEVVDEKKN